MYSQSVPAFISKNVGNTLTNFKTWNGILINVKEYGAKGDGKTDDTAAIQKAINYAFSLGEGQFAIVYFPPGIYCISSTILHIQEGNYCRLQGSGVKQTILKAIKPITNMLTLSDATGVHTRKIVEGFTFDENNLASCAIDATYLRYSQIRDNEFINVAVDGYAVKFGRWVNRFLGNIINGQDLAFTGTPTSNGLLIPADTINNFIIERNSFTSCKSGIVCEAFPNDVRIQFNEFDSCSGAGIWFKSGGRLVDISKNAFENCGKTGVQVEVSAGTFQTWVGAIVGHNIYNATASTPFRDLIIDDNQFADCSTDSIMTLGGLLNADIRRNNMHNSYSSTYFVNLRGIGSLYTVSKRVLIEHSHSGQYTQLVGLNAADKRFNHSGLIIREYFKDSDSTEKGFELINPYSAGWTGSWTVAATYIDGIFTENEVTATTTHKTLSLTLENSGYSAVKGRYLRLHALTKNTVANGLRLKIGYDGVNQIDISSSTTTYLDSWHNAVIFVPSTVAVIDFDLALTVTGQNCFISKFNICDASLDFHEMRYLMKDL